jgi:TPR repeat protein
MALLDDPSPKRLRAPEHLKNACDGDHAGACNDLGWAYERGFGTLATDPQKAEALFAKSCRLGNSLGCLNRGRIVRDKNSAEAAEFMKKACEANHQKACEELGDAR